MLSCIDPHKRKKVLFILTDISNNDGVGDGTNYKWYRVLNENLVNKQDHPYMKRLKEIDLSQIPFKADNFSQLDCKLNYDTEYKDVYESRSNMVAPYFRIKNLARFQVSFRNTLKYSAFCKEKPSGTPSNTPSVSLMYIADFVPNFEFTNQFEMTNSRYFLAHTENHNPAGYNKLAIMYGVFNPCKKSGGENKPNTVVYNIQPGYDEFEVYKDLTLEMAFFQKPGFTPVIESAQMRSLYEKLPYFKGLVFSREGKMYGRSFLRSIYYSSNENSVLQGRDGKALEDIDRQIVFVKDDKATLFLDDNIKIKDLETELIYSNANTHALLMESKKDWYKLFMAVLPIEWQMKADCLGLKDLFADAKVCIKDSSDLQFFLAWALFGLIKLISLNIY